MNPWGQRCWLLTSPRSGSTWLQYLLNHNAGVPLRIGDDREQARYSFGEHMSEKYCRSLEEFLQWDPVVSKVHCHHFGAYLIDRPLLKSRLPPLRFVLLERRDQFAQAASLAMANRTGITQCQNLKKQNEFRASSVKLEDAELVACLKAVNDYTAFWRNWLHSESHLVVTYESLLEDPASVVGEVLSYLQTPHESISVDVPLRKLNHPETERNISRSRQLV